MYIQIWTDKFAPGWEGEIPVHAPLHKQVPATVAAFTAEYQTDAHFAPYWLESLDGQVPPKAPRVNKDALPKLEELGFSLRFQLAAFDVDCPEAHAAGEDAEAPAAWRDELDAALKAASWPLSCYQTRRGARVLALLPEPVDQPTFVRWRTAFATALAECGVLVDRATIKDWNRCYRLPRVVRAGRQESYSMNLASLDAGQAAIFDPGAVQPPDRPGAALNPYAGIEEAGCGPTIQWPDEIIGGGQGKEPGRNVALTRLLGQYRNFGMQRRDLAILAHAINNSRCRPPMDEREVETVVDSVARMDVHPPAAIRNIVHAQHEETRRRARAEAQQGGSFLGKLSDLMPAALRQMERRAAGLDVPVPLPWPALAEALRGGLWPGMYVTIGNTGTGKTQFALQVALNAAQAGHPVVYVSLELESNAVCARLIGLAMRTQWSDLYLGQDVEAVAEAAAPAATLADLDRLRVVAYQPFTFSANTLTEIAQVMRTEWPALVDQPVAGVATPKPPLVILDYLQLVTDLHDDGQRMELRERIGRAAGHGRAIATEFNAAVLLLSSTARSNYQRLAGWKGGGNEPEPINFTTTEPNSFVGMGKESGEIEYFADGVFVLVQDRNRVRQDTPDVQIGLAKFRSGKSAWVPLVFNGYAYIPDPIPRIRRPDAAEDPMDTAEPAGRETIGGGIAPPTDEVALELAIPD